MERIELETTPEMKVAVWSFFETDLGTTWQKCSFSVQELNWHKIHFIVDVFPNLSNVVC